MMRGLTKGHPGMLRLPSVSQTLLLMSKAVDVLVAGLVSLCLSVGTTESARSSPPHGFV